MSKLNIILFFVLFGCALNAYSQRQITLGPKAAITLSKYTTNLDDIKESLKFNVQYGLFARFGGKFYFQPEILLSKRDGLIVLNNYKNTFLIKSIDVPLLVGFKVIELGSLQLRATGGVIAFVAVDKAVDNSNYDKLIDKNNYNDINWGIQFGLGADFLFLTADLRYELGKNNINKLKNFDLKNNLISLSLGIKVF